MLVSVGIKLGIAGRLFGCLHLITPLALRPFRDATLVLELCREDKMGGLRTGIRPVHISAISKMVSDYSGMMVQPHKAIVGANAFAHESGIHQDGMLKSRDTYEIMRPETIGLQRQDQAGAVPLLTTQNAAYASDHLPQSLQTLQAAPCHTDSVIAINARGTLKITLI